MAKRVRLKKTVKISCGRDLIRMLEEVVKPYSNARLDPYRQIRRENLQKLLDDFHTMRIALQEEGYELEGYKRYRVRLAKEKEWNERVAEEGEKMKRFRQRRNK